MPVSTAAVHDFLAEFAFEFADRFLDDAGQPGNSVERLGFAGEG